MMSASWLIFWISLFLTASVFLLYPLFLLVLSLVCSRHQPPASVNNDEERPTVSIIIVARNAAAWAENKIDNCLALDYPPDKLEIVFGSDGSTDGTETILSNRSEPRLKCFYFHEHQGKIAVLNQLVRHSSGEILLFTDVDAMLDKNVLTIMRPYLAQPFVGGVCGQRIIRQPGVLMEAGQRGYLRFDSLIKTLEDRNDSITSNDGKLYAIHRTLFAPIPEGVTDDLYVALGVTARGYRFRFAPAARAVIPPPVHSPGHEIRRRRRIVAQSLRGIFRMHSLLAVQKHGIFAIGLFINKIVRRLLPLLLPAWGCAALLLWQQHVFYALAALVLPSSILIALLYPFVETVPSRCQSTKNASLQYRSAHLLTRLSSVSAYFWLGHIGTLLGLLDALCRRTITKWEPEKNRERLPDRSVAYIMSRFPKITETFVLHEMISVLEHSIALAVYPLLREHESVSHPEIRRILPQVQYTAFISVAVLSANLRFFIQKPSAYLATLCILLTGTLRCPQTLFKTLAIFPKSVYLAHLARKRHIGHVHAHFATYPATAAFIMHRLTAIPFSFTAHAHDILMDRSLLAEKMKAAAFTVTISEFNQRLLARHDGFRSRIEIVRCGVNLSQFDPALRRRHPSSSCISLVCVASYKDMKGHTYLIEAFTLLREKGLAFTCHLIGDGPLKETIRSRIHQSKLEQQVIMHGSLAGPDVRRVLAAADIAVLPCVVGKRGDHDGIPVFLMEAMAMELPAVSTRLSGIPELIEDGHTGFLVPPGNSRALADALLLLAADPVLRRRMGKAARMQVKAHFDLDRNNARLVGLFDSSFPRRSAQETAE